MDKTLISQILAVLGCVGEGGIKVKKLAMHIYNANCSLFGSPNFSELHERIQQFLYANSHSDNPLVESTGVYGYYRLAPIHAAAIQQLFINFEEFEPIEIDDTDIQETVKELPLFPDYEV